MPHLQTGRVLLAAVAFYGSAAFAADPQLMNLVMPDAQVMAGVNVTNSANSPLGQFFLNKVTADDYQGLQNFINQTGFDPRVDVTEVLVASSASPAAHTGLVLAKGTFNVSKLLAALANDTNHQVSNYGPATLIVSTKASDNFALAFLGSTVSILGDATSVKAAVDRSSGSNAVSPALAAQVQTLSTNEDVWSVSTASLAALLPGNVTTGGGANQSANQMLQIVKNIQQASSGIKFGANVQFTAQAVADTPQNAGSLADVIKMLTGLISMSAAGQTAEGAAIAQLLQSVQVTTDGTAVNLAATIPESQIEALLNAAPHVKATAGKKM